MNAATIDEQIECVKREIKQRAHVYPRLVASGKMTQEFANRQTKLMTDVLVTLVHVRYMATQFMNSDTGTVSKALVHDVCLAAPLPQQGQMF